MLCLSIFAGINVTLSWDPSYPGDSVTITNYNVYYGVRPGVYTNSVMVGTATNATIEITNGVRYFFAATAVDTNGLESVFSQQATWPLLGRQVIANRVTAVTVTISGR